MANSFLDTTPNIQATTTKNRYTGLHQNKEKLLCFKVHNQESEKTTDRMGEITCKLYICHGSYIQTNEELLRHNSKNVNNPILKRAKDLNRRFFRINTDCQ